MNKKKYFKLKIQIKKMFQNFLKVRKSIIRIHVKKSFCEICLFGKSFSFLKGDKISIVLPVYNSEGGIKRCLSSLVNQTYRNIEIIVVYLKSTDKTLDIIKSFNKEVVFHRAFDCVKDVDKAMNILIELGVDRVLTSGLMPKAMDGIDTIAYLQEKYGDKIEILAGSGMNASNAKEMMEKTGISQVHSSCKGYRNDSTTSGKFVNYCYAGEPHQNDYDVVDEELVRKIVNSI